MTGQDPQGTKNHHKSFDFGACALGCGTVVTAMHYSRVHGMKLQDSFSNGHQKEGVGTRRPLSCKTCRAQGKPAILAGSHEAMAHLASNHPELISAMAPVSPLSDDGTTPVASGEETRKPWEDLPTLDGLFFYTYAKRRQAEVEVARLTRFEARVAELEKDLVESRDYAKLLEDDNERLKRDKATLEAEREALRIENRRSVESIKILYEENKALRVGGQASKQFYEAHADMLKGR